MPLGGAEGQVPGSVARPDSGRGSSPPVPERTPEPGPESRLAALRHHSWTVWSGQHTHQYWAAHTGRMRLIRADTPEELIRSVAAVTAAPGISPSVGSTGIPDPQRCRDRQAFFRNGQEPPWREQADVMEWKP
ncbi:hypothetical protein [Nocardiopsis dassonvillei]|uniref:hypothetical protein n=1 Tax=Nocardiopsis dassonvillei TaxID=2014 RepID=UPI00157BCE4B|nr:hypothetical protein [Nocardiopsis dassonvillei]